MFPVTAPPIEHCPPGLERDGNMLGNTHRPSGHRYWRMTGWRSPFRASNDSLFDEYDAFVPDHLPSVGAFLNGHDVLTGRAHVEFHTQTREIFEARGVYDMTFDYNLAQLNLDTRHEAAGYRYAEEADNSSVLRAEFTPTTSFCPQTHTLTIGSFRAWNGLRDCHDYELVRVRAAEMHHQSDAINAQLAELEAVFKETGSMPDLPSGLGSIESTPIKGGTRVENDGEGPHAPF